MPHEPGVIPDKQQAAELEGSCCQYYFINSNTRNRKLAMPQRCFAVDE